jgi:hypothetical protein
MTLIRKDTPGSAPGGYEWSIPDDEVDVPRELAGELIAIPDGGFHEVGDEVLPEPVVPDFAPPGDGLDPHTVSEPVVPLQINPGDHPCGATGDHDEADCPVCVSLVGQVTSDPTQIVEPTPVPEHLVTEPHPEPENAVTEAEPIPKLKADVIKMANRLGVSSEGTVKQITDRIKAHQASQ